MPSLRSLLLLGLPLASFGLTHAADIREIVNDVPEESLRAALEQLRPKYREGVFEDHKDAVHAVHRDDPALAMKLMETAQQEATIMYEPLRRS